MENKDTVKISKKLIIGIIAAILVIVAALLVIKPWSNNQVESTKIESQVQENASDANNKTEEPSTCKDSVSCCLEDTSCKTVKMNAYDFIMEVMSRPQFWDRKEVFVYGFDIPWVDEYTTPKLDEQNQGWTLVDEKTASFKRGVQGVLTINFAKNTANSIVSQTFVFQDEDYNDLSNFDKFEFDFNKKEYKVEGNYPEEWYQVNEQNCPGYAWCMLKEEWYESEFPFDERYVIEDTMLWYDSIFKEVGCPLLNQPEGTLASYKNKEVTVPEDLSTLSYVNRANDGLIHAPWLQEGFDWDWTKKDNQYWIDNLSDIFNKQVPDTGLKDTKGYILSDGTAVECDYYAPVFLVEASPKRTTDEKYYLYEQSGNADFNGIFALYFLQPMMEKIYGYNAVYLYDVEKLPVTPHHSDYRMHTKEDFVNKISRTSDGLGDGDIFPIYPNGTMPVGNTRVIQETKDDYKYKKNGFNYVKELAEYYNVEFPYADDYMTNYHIWASLDDQKILGLR